MSPTRGPTRPPGDGYSPRVPAKKGRSPGGRFDEREISARVEKLRRDRGVEVKEICAAIGLEKWDWSRKVRLDRSTFSIRELGLIADYLDAPTGWPFVAPEVGQLLDRLLKPH
jgi:hypothetical protein